MATVNDPKTADNDYEQYNVASVVFDIGEDTSVGGGFSTLKSRDVTIKIGVRDFGKWNLNTTNL